MTQTAVVRRQRMHARTAWVRIAPPRPPARRLTCFLVSRCSWLLLVVAALVRTRRAEQGMLVDDYAAFDDVSDEV